MKNIFESVVFLNEGLFDKFKKQQSVSNNKTNNIKNEISDTDFQTAKNNLKLLSDKIFKLLKSKFSKYKISMSKRNDSVDDIYDISIRTSSSFEYKDYESIIKYLETFVAKEGFKFAPEYKSMYTIWDSAKYPNIDGGICITPEDDGADLWLNTRKIVYNYEK